MKIQSPKRIIVEDFDSEDRNTVEKLGFTVNTFNEDVFNAMNKNLTIEDNLNQQIKTLSNIEVDGSGKPITSLAFQNNLKGKIQGTQVIRVLGGIPTAQPFITFTESNNVVTINNISGLASGTKYTIYVLLFGN